MSKITAMVVKVRTGKWSANILSTHAQQVRFYPASSSDSVEVFENQNGELGGKLLMSYLTIAELENRVFERHRNRVSFYSYSRFIYFEVLKCKKSGS